MLRPLYFQLMPGPECQAGLGSYNGTKGLLQNWWALRVSWDEKLQLFQACLWQSKAVCVLPNI